MPIYKLLRLAAVLSAAFAITAGPASALKVTWMTGSGAPGTPAKYDRVGVIKIGPRPRQERARARTRHLGRAHLLRPSGQWIVSKAKGWQVWSVERRENLLEDQSTLNRAKAGKASIGPAFNYYLGYIKDPSIKHHFRWGQGCGRRVCEAVGPDGGHPGPAPRDQGGRAPGRQGRARGPLARRSARDRVCDLELPWPSGGRRPGRPGLRRWRQLPSGERPSRHDRAQTLQRAPALRGCPSAGSRPRWPDFTTRRDRRRRSPPPTMPSLGQQYGSAHPEFPDGLSRRRPCR